MTKKQIDHIAPDSDETREMEAEYNSAKESAEVQEIKASQEAIHDVLWWKKRLDWTGWVAYFIGFILWALMDRDGGVYVLLLGIGLVIGNSFVNGYRLQRRRMICQNLLDALNRKNALPLYHQLQEKFSDMPHLHIHLAENGTIIITDRNKGGSK